MKKDKNEPGVVFTVNSLKRYVYKNTYVGMAFYIRKSDRYLGNGDLRYTIDSFYPHIVTTIDQNGHAESFTYMELYWFLHNKFNEREDGQ